MKTATLPKSDNIAFSVVTKPVTYGDNAVFHEYQIRMLHKGKVVGVQRGPRRATQSQRDAKAMAGDRIEELKTHRLFVVPVKRSDITHGEGRSCIGCAIARALCRRREQMGFSDWDFQIRVVPYACFADADGIQIVPQYRRMPHLMTGGDGMPDVVIQGRNDIYVETMLEWARAFDDWDDSRHMAIKDWREERGYDDGERPYRPSPCSFVLDVSELKRFRSNR